jgi:hypothetical protein
MAAQLRREVQSSCDVLLPMAKLLSKATLAELADHVAAEARGKAGAAS